MINKIEKIKSTVILVVFLLISLNFLNAANSEKEIRLETTKGILYLIPLNDNSIRVRFVQTDSKEIEDLIYIEQKSTPRYTLSHKKDGIVLTLKEISAEFSVKDETLIFKDKNGVILEEKTGTRSMIPSSVQGESTYKIEQAFVSPTDEYIYGTGQFQDGYLNVRGLTRRLTQVNTQIAIPFILSNKGYGLLWNNQGLTDFNPAREFVSLKSKKDNNDKVTTVNVTSTDGGKTEERKVHSFTGTISVPETGRYSLLLDVGQKMARKYYLSVDGENILDINNTWLPPTTSLILQLEKGVHNVEFQGDRADSPILYYRLVMDETVFSSPVAQAIDYTVFAGTPDAVIASYRQLTGEVPMMPIWALGYIHCRERYNTQEELLQNAKEFRKRKLPVDVIVQDWQYWGKYGWNSMKFDEDKYPDPKLMVDQLHDLNMKLMISVWSKIDMKSDVGKEMVQKGFYIPQTEWVDFFNPDAAACYWSNFRDRLLIPYKIDAWWQDATEPENDDLEGRFVNNGKIPGEVYRNVYPLYVNRTVYEGLRQDNPNKRNFILSRSGFSGVQRYSVATWSGDVGHDWETFRRQITAGLGQMATGIPWWTYDAGGFFRPHEQYTNKDYQEQLVRWIQAGTFFPLLRVHGFMSNTEPWRYGTDVEHTIAQYLNFRYRMLPYIYSQAAKVSFEGSTLMRPLVMDFFTDNEALKQDCEFMFGSSILVSPVTQPSVNHWPVYLPKNEHGWFDFWTGMHFSGGQTIKVDVDLQKIPLFVKAGSILPLGGEKQYTTEPKNEPVEIRIYPGSDALFTIYEDEGDNYNYEKGKYATFDLVWNDKSRKIKISDIKGNFDGLQINKTFNIVIVDSESGLGTKVSDSKYKTVFYDGKSIEVSL